MTFRILAAFSLCLAALMTTQSAAQPASVADQAEIARLSGILKDQHRQTGDVKIGEAQVTLHLGDKYYLLPANEAKTVLKEWGNPPSAAEDVLAIVFPADKTFLDKTWGAVITYQADGYVSDSEADSTDYDELLKSARAGEDAENAELSKAGYATTHLVGWAQPPAYDKIRHHLIWARNIKFSGMDENTLNYDVRLLGRHGFLSMNLVATMPEFGDREG